ncbi:RNA-binding cell elongation regulator Jag/EloR [Abyssisolibacter fermentans]|uniref:RNA-binding cell elongation regulator Jag/EloR n=1 Tax=Abyssisolibacter fermentans TaxID=1766203 RepID=UPI000834CEB2|nr:RNA-binding cell elongation regulator Jag/EloR [Abyssisolibacter fermentans]
MRTLIKISKTIDSAVDEALKDLQVERDDITYEVLDEPNKGFLGIIGNRDAKVKIIVSNDPVEKARSFLNDLLRKMNLNATVEIVRDKNDLNIEIKGENPEDMGVIIGKRGKTLDSIQYLVNLVVNKKRNNYLRIVVDTENYRKKRQETLERLARKMADKAKRYRKSIRLEPMNPYERRIIHSALQDDMNINTYSEGKEPYRKVVIENK